MWQQFSRVNDVDSVVQKIDIGMPQGSCLEPLLFLVYINDLPQVVLNSSVTMYGDDTSLSMRNKNLADPNEAIDKDL